eukprot:4483707-Pleurochrysis_carterae.AAC.1
MPPPDAAASMPPPDAAASIPPPDAAAQMTLVFLDCRDLARLLGQVYHWHLHDLVVPCQSAGALVELVAEVFEADHRH